MQIKTKIMFISDMVSLTYHAAQQVEKQKILLHEKVKKQLTSY